MRRNCVRASDMPAAVQRSGISPCRQRLTLRAVVRPIDHRFDAVGRAQAATQRVGLNCSRLTVNVSAMPSRRARSGTRIRALPGLGQRGELAQRAVRFLEGLRRPQPAPREGVLLLGRRSSTLRALCCWQRWTSARRVTRQESTLAALRST